MSKGPSASDPGAMLTAFGTVLMTTLVAFERMGVLDVAWTGAIISHSEESIRRSVPVEQRDAVLRSLGSIAGLLEDLRATSRDAERSN
jgi:hypothetical protein